MKIKPFLPPGATVAHGSYSRKLFGQHRSVTVVASFAGAAGDLLRVTVETADTAFAISSVTDSAGTLFSASSPSVFVGKMTASHEESANEFTVRFAGEVTDPEVRVQHWGTT